MTASYSTFEGVGGWGQGGGVGDGGREGCGGGGAPGWGRRQGSLESREATALRAPERLLRTGHRVHASCPQSAAKRTSPAAAAPTVGACGAAAAAPHAARRCCAGRAAAAASRWGAGVHTALAPCALCRRRRPLLMGAPRGGEGSTGLAASARPARPPCRSLPLHRIQCASCAAAGKARSPGLAPGGGGEGRRVARRCEWRGGQGGRMVPRRGRQALEPAAAAGRAARPRVAPLLRAAPRATPPLRCTPTDAVAAARGLRSGGGGGDGARSMHPRGTRCRARG
jgi:hypothetical protein